MNLLIKVYNLILVKIDFDVWMLLFYKQTSNRNMSTQKLIVFQWIFNV